jgi:hypothetical protein
MKYVPWVAKNKMMANLSKSTVISAFQWLSDSCTGIVQSIFFAENENNT